MTSYSDAKAAILAGLVSQLPTRIKPETVASLVANLTDAIVASLSGYEVTSEKNAANGYAGLDSSGLVPWSILPAALFSDPECLGLWNASTNSPSLSSSTKPAGLTPNYGFYVVSTSGSTTLDGISSWSAGDWLFWNNGGWKKISGGSNAVVSVASLTGTITAAALKTALAIATSDVSGYVAPVNADWNAGSGLAQILNKPTIPSTSKVATAWVSFAGSNGTIASSSNVASVTRNGTGDYTITFSAAMADTNYAVIATSERASESGSNNSLVTNVYHGGKTTASVRVVVYRPTTSSGMAQDTDPSSVGVVVFGT